jgi:hypothetical protein
MNFFIALRASLPPSPRWWTRYWGDRQRRVRERLLPTRRRHHRTGNITGTNYVIDGGLIKTT